MNVALTRCRKGMVVVTDKSFLQRTGNMLLGELCYTWAQHDESCWIDWKAMLNNSAALPGLPLPLPPSTPLYYPALAVQQLALYGSQQQQALARVNEQSRPNILSERAATPPRDPPPSKPMTWAQLSQSSRSTLARPAWGSASTIEPQRRIAVKAADLVRPTVGQTEYRGGRSDTPTAAAPRELDDDEFPPLPQLATALDQSPSSQRRWPNRR
jgi:hypothetical protein